MKSLLNYLKLFNDPGIIDGYVTLTYLDGSIPHMTRGIPEGKAPNVIKYDDTLFGDTGKYDFSGFRIYKENFGIYEYEAHGE